jgi:hypothetical protein
MPITSSGAAPVTFIFLDADQYDIVLRALGLLWAGDPKRDRLLMPTDYVVAVARAWESRA